MKPLLIHKKSTPADLPGCREAHHKPIGNNRYPLCCRGKHIYHSRIECLQKEPFGATNFSLGDPSYLPAAFLHFAVPFKSPFPYPYQQGQPILFPARTVTAHCVSTQFRYRKTPSASDRSPCAPAGRSAAFLQKAPGHAE